MFKLAVGVYVVVLVLFVEEMWAGLRRSMETVPLRSRVKCLSVRLIIRNGPL